MKLVWYYCSNCNSLWQGEPKSNTKEYVTSCCYSPAELSRRASKEQIELVGEFN